MHGADAAATDREAAVAEHADGARPDVQDDGGVLIHPEDERLLREFALQGGQPALPEVTEPGVVMPALGVVVVRDDDGGQAGEVGDEVQPALQYGGSPAL